MSRSYLFSSESVTEGHPDKLADRISDSILDAMLSEDPQSRVACETLVTTGFVMVSGEITTEGWVDIPSVVRATITDVGYTNAKFGLDGETCGVVTAIQEQSADIARGVEDSFEHREGHSGDELDMLGAGDQGMMFGFACRETEELMPLPIAMAHRLSRRLADVRKAGVVPYLRPDGKSQVSIEYRDGKPVGVDSVLISAQHREEVDVETLLKPDIIAEVIDPVLKEFPEIDVDYCHVDAATMFFVSQPQRFDVIVTDNLFGDIITDLAAAVSGGIGLAASGNIDATRTNPSMFEPVHGSAPDIAGQGIADPTAAITSVALLHASTKPWSSIWLLAVTRSCRRRRSASGSSRACRRP